MTDTKRFTDDLDKATILGAIARGWCHEENATKEMDGDLAGAIADEVEKVIATLRAELDAARGRVRPLVWGDRPDGLDYRIGRCGQISYCVRCENGQWGYSRHGDVGLAVSYKGLPLFTDEQDAINGAEVDHRARILAALEPDPAVARMREPDSDWGDFIWSALNEAEKAMRKFPQPNYVISKIAEEAGEVVKAAIHCAEGRETTENVRGEMKQLVTMLYRLWVEGDQVHGMLAARTSGTGEG